MKLELSQATFDELSFMMDFEDGKLNSEQLKKGFQKLIDNDHVWKLQGVYGRTAINLIRQGWCVDTNNRLTK